MGILESGARLDQITFTTDTTDGIRSRPDAKHLSDRSSKKQRYIAKSCLEHYSIVIFIKKYV